MELAAVLGKVVALESEARRLLAWHEAAEARTITLEDSYSRLNDLSIAQDELFRESLRAIEHQLYRAAHVLAWGGFMDFLHNLLTKDVVALQKVRPKWQVKTADDLREHADFQS